MDIKKTNLKFRGILSNRNITKYIIYHHAEHGNCSVYDIHSWHLNNDWSGIGYNFFVRKDGSIWEGRPENKIGAHALGYNDISIGICAEGRYMFETMPEAQKKALIELGIYLKNKYNISSNNIIGHRDVNSTTCPGIKYPLQEIKQAVLKGQTPTINSYINIDGGGTRVGGNPALNLIIREYKEVDRVFGHIEGIDNALWAFDVNPPNTNYAKLQMNANQIAVYKGLESNKKYKIIASGYKDGKKVTETSIVLKTLEQQEKVEEKLYRVQTGAFANKKYAENLRDELKEKGYKDTYIKEE